MQPLGRPLNIAFLLGRFPELSETFVINQITGMLDRGAKVRIYAIERSSTPPLHTAISKYDLTGLVTYASPVADVIRQRIRSKAALSAIQLFRTLKRRNLPTSFLRNLRADVEMGLQFPALRAEPARHDIIHCHFGPYGQWGAGLRSMGLLSGRLVTTFHGYDMTKYVRQHGPGVYSRLFREGDLFLPISNYWQSKLIEMGCPPGRTEVHRMGVNTRQFMFRQRDMPDPDGLRLISIGRLVEKKGFEYAIRALRPLVDRWPGLKYTIVGDGPLRPFLSTLIGELGLGSSVELAGRRSSGEVADFLTASHLLIAPSVTAADGDQEGIPVVIMEAMANGLPVVSTLHTGIPELVKDGVTGLLVPERSADAISQAIETLAVDAERSRAFSFNARKTIEDEYDVNTLNDALLSRFKKLVRDRDGVDVAAS